MKMKRKVITDMILALSFFIAVLSFQASYSASIDEVAQFETGVKTQLCMVIDGSDSLRSTEWNTIKQGIAKAINTTMPCDGSVELTLVQFGYSPSDGYAKTEIPPTVINSTNHGTIANRVLTITQGGIGTSMAHGLYLGWKEISDSPNFETAKYQIFNLATDGEPNRRNNNATSDLDGDGYIDYWDDVIAVVNNAVNQGLEELDIEGISIIDSSRDWFKNWVVHPQPGILAPPFSKPGWIRVVEDATEFANTIDQKLQLVVFPEETYTLAVNIIGNGSVSKNPNQTTYFYGTTVEVTAIPDSCYKLDHWELDGVNIGSANPYNITMDSDHSLHTVFTQREYTLTVNVAGNGSVTKNPDSATHSCGTVVTLTAIPDSGWSFSHWSDHLSASANPETITINNDKTVTAHFTQDKYPLMISVVGSGSVTRNLDQATYSYGASIELTATADRGWTFSHWSGDLIGSTNPDSITMADNRTVTAHFTQDEIWAPALEDAVAGGVATVAMTTTLAAMSSSLVNPAASAGSSFWSKIAAALPDSLQNLLQSYGEEVLACKTQKQIEAKEFSGLVITPTEVLAFVLGAAALTSCFSFAIAGATAEIANVVPIVFVTVVVAELVYWLTTEVVAKSMGIWSEYCVWPIGIVMLLVSTLAFRSPFCVAGRSKFRCAKPTKRSIGLISLSGPVACLLLAGIFVMLLIFGYEQIGSLGVMVCMTKATFDLIPTPPMNGKEIFDWNKIIWLMLFLPSAASYFFFILNF
jgi:uncharacterized repeat protein (TIGR02543 family)